ncbi:hypothetical protein [Megasphaera elsdenii]|uniref:hypothetical protein n=1 Tax=Megasphaera elsdenii TaxID=907 RepID=UPI0021F6FB58|nr:hypothetical protein [Megasphaera elsdenii]
MAWRLFCRGLGFRPGAFTSTKAIIPSGKSTNRSGMPLYDGEINFNAMPPRFLVSITNLISVVRSRMNFSFL